MTTITPQDFVDRWQRSELREQQSAQSHFNELCQLVNHKTPTQLDPEGKFFTFEEHVEKATGGKGRADVWYDGHFAWEYKGKHRDLDAAYAQLLAYRGGLNNPPLLVVSDMLEYRIYPQWTNTSGIPFKFTNQDLLQLETRRFITWLLEKPAKFLELRQTELEKRERITFELANKFAHLADLMRQHSEPKWESLRIARFLTKLVFCLFVEDVELLPRPYNQSILRNIIDRAKDFPAGFADVMRSLFEAMDGRKSNFEGLPIPYFNGGLFHDTTPEADDGLDILNLIEIPGAINILEEASESDWRYVNPTIFGTLFEGALDPSKRAQLGAHYTSEADIRLVVEPVLMQPLIQQWDTIRAQAEPLMQTFVLGEASPKAKSAAKSKLIPLHDSIMTALETTRVLDPACGSGNFLYVSLRALKDLEGAVRKFFEPLGLPFRDVVTPRQLYGIEKDIFAARLAHVVVWIGYLQWRYEDEGVLHPVLRNRSAHPRNLPEPIIRDKLSEDEPDRIINDDAIMRYDADGKPYEPEWAEADVIVGNPPFLGDKYMRLGRADLGQAGLGDKYVDDLRALYKDRLPSLDLVGYWFEKARTAIERSKAKRAGLISTNSIRGGSNRTVLDRIKETCSIFMAWGDRAWVLDGAAVRISIVGFGDNTEQQFILDGAPVNQINADLQNTIDATKARRLTENGNLTFQGPVKVGAFDISGVIAQQMLVELNSSGVKNSDVLKPYLNAQDIVQQNRNYWIIDFADLSQVEAAKYKLPFQHIEKYVKPARINNRDEQRRANWWKLGRSGDTYREATRKLNRQIFTPRVSKHRVFVWVGKTVFPSDAVVAIARDDDYFFGVLHSYLHEIWSLRLGTWLGKGNDPRYTPTTTFETFPFPYAPAQEDIASPHHAAISAAAQQLHAERDAWLNPPDLIALGAQADSPALRERTLTNLYNALEDHRALLAGQAKPATEGKKKKTNDRSAALAFAPRLAELHAALDSAVLAAYGWSDLADKLRTADGDEELLKRLLALNLKRADQG